MTVRATTERMRRRDLLCGLASGLLAGCGGPTRGGRGEERPPGKIRLVFKHQPLWGDPAPFRGLLSAFEREVGDVEVVTEALPSSSDLVHQFLLTALEGGARLAVIMEQEDRVRERLSLHADYRPARDIEQDGWRDIDGQAIEVDVDACDVGVIHLRG